MVKKITDGDGNPLKEKELHNKRLKRKHLHQHAGKAARAELEGLSPDKLPPASSSNAARQVRSRLNITFPVDWQERHLKKQAEQDEKDQKEARES